MPINRFDRPIPGQSLTTPPRNAKWEKPPKYTNKDDALEFIMQQLFTAEHGARMVVLLEGGASVEQLTKVILFSGFMEGLWTHDLSVLMAKPVAAMIVTIFKVISGKVPKVTDNQGQADPGLAQSMRATADMKPKEITPQEKTEITQQLKTSGILGRK